MARTLEQWRATAAELSDEWMDTLAELDRLRKRMGLWHRADEDELLAYCDGWAVEVVYPGAFECPKHGLRSIRQRVHVNHVIGAMTNTGWHEPECCRMARRRAMLVANGRTAS